MKAVVLREIDNPKQLKIEKVVANPVPGPGEVVVRLHMAALNRRDLYVIYGKQPGIQLLAIPGMDGAGEVIEVGEGVGTGLIGHEVVINPGLFWGDNPRVHGRLFRILGIPTEGTYRDGTYAQYVKVPIEAVYEKPPYLTWEEAATIPVDGLTAYRTVVTRGNVQEGETG